MLERQIKLGIVNCFGGGGGGYVAPNMEAPKKSDIDVQAAMEKERNLARLRKGRASTILTSGLGIDNSTGKKTLLGA